MARSRLRMRLPCHSGSTYNVSPSLSFTSFLFAHTSPRCLHNKRTEIKFDSTPFISSVRFDVILKTLSSQSLEIKFSAFHFSRSASSSSFINNLSALSLSLSNFLSLYSRYIVAHSVRSSDDDGSSQSTFVNGGVLIHSARVLVVSASRGASKDTRALHRYLYIQVCFLWSPVAFVSVFRSRFRLPLVPTEYTDRRAYKNTASGRYCTCRVYVQHAEGADWQDETRERKSEWHTYLFSLSSSHRR